MDKLSCPVCASDQVYPFIIRDNVPVHQNRLFRSLESAIATRTGKLHLHACEKCGFVFNASFDESKLEYNANYDNNQNYSNAFNQYTDQICKYIIDKYDHGNKTLIEIGCGKGQFITQLFKLSKQITGFGFDPSYEGSLSQFEGRLQFKRDFYGTEYSHIKADIVICRHVIEHIAHPVELLKTVNRALRSSRNARVFFETPCIEWILQNQVIWDFFYEHCSYFSKSSITTAFQLAGFDIANITHVFGGQYLWVEAVPINEDKSYPIDRSQSDIRTKVESYVRQESEILERWSKQILEYSYHGNLGIWGAGAKGVTFLNLFDKNRKNIRCAIDLNPNKQGKFIPGSGHEIVGYERLRDLEIRNIIVMNPNYTDEIQFILEKENLSANLIELE